MSRRGLSPEEVERQTLERLREGLAWATVWTWPERALVLRRCGACGHGLADVVPVRWYGGKALTYRCRRCGLRNDGSDAATMWLGPVEWHFQPVRPRFPFPGMEALSE